MHVALCHIARSGLPERAAEWIDAQTPAWNAHLTEAGLSGPDLDHCRAEAGRQLANVLADETGRWILAGGTDAVSEFAVSGIVDGAIQSFRFDRAFEFEGERWVIDYKTGPFDAGRQAREKLIARYRPKLEQYRTLAAEIYGQPVRCALYLTSVPMLIEV